MRSLSPDANVESAGTRAPTRGRRGASRRGSPRTSATAARWASRSLQQHAVDRRRRATGLASAPRTTSSPRPRRRARSRSTPVKARISSTCWPPSSRRSTRRSRSRWCVAWRRLSRRRWRPRPGPARAPRISSSPPTATGSTPTRRTRRSARPGVRRPGVQQGRERPRQQRLRGRRGRLTYASTPSASRGS